jgi:acetyl-CoA carboxylase carboxyltransferase component
MDSKSVGSDLSLAWPTAELAVMGPQGAVEIIYRRELQEDKNPDLKRNELVEDYVERFANPYVAAERGFVDDVIDPTETRKRLIDGLEMLASKRTETPRRKHGNIPL